MSCCGCTRAGCQNSNRVHERIGPGCSLTGASRGIRLAIARDFVTEGAPVVAGSLSISAELRALAGSGDVTTLDVDLADRIARPPRRGGGDRIDILVNNVADAPPRLDGFLAITGEMSRQAMKHDLRWR